MKATRFTLIIVGFLLIVTGAVMRYYGIHSSQYVWWAGTGLTLIGNFIRWQEYRQMMKKLNRQARNN